MGQIQQAAVQQGCLLLRRGLVRRTLAVATIVGRAALLPCLADQTGPCGQARVSSASAAPRFGWKETTRTHRGDEESALGASGTAATEEPEWADFLRRPIQIALLGQDFR